MQNISSSVSLFVVACVMLCVLTIAAVTGVSLLRPGDNSQLILQIIGISAPFILLLMALIQRENHALMNSRLSELLESSKKASLAQGKAEGPDIKAGKK